MLKPGGDRRTPLAVPNKKLHSANVASAASVLDSSVGSSVGGSLEVVSLERFQQQLEAMSSPSDVTYADRHAVRGDGYSSQHLSQRVVRNTRGKRHAPIVVCLRESIRAVGRSAKLRPVSVTRRTLSESNASDANVLVKLAPLGTSHGKRATKNFSAFLSAVEKAHTKEGKFVSCSQNINESANPSDQKQLNNSVDCRTTTTETQLDLSRLLSFRGSVDVIHNDLRTAIPDVSAASDDQSEKSEDSCSSRLSTTESDTEPGDDSSTTRKNSECCEVSPQHCPQCLAAYYAYTHYYALGSKYFKIEVVEENDTNSDGFAQRGQTEPNSPTWMNSTSATETLLQHRHIDVVSLDLTGSDVTFTVEQHSTDSLSQEGASLSSCPEFIHNFYCTMFGFVPCLPGYCFVPAFYFTFPMWSVPKPLSSTSKKSSTASQQRRHSSTMHGERLCTFRPSLPPAPQRPWITLGEPAKNKPVAIFTVMCYNVLCDKYATRQLYGYCPSWALNWQHRRRHIFNEIHHYGADVINLQEVETEQFYSFFLPELQADGYDGIFAPKSRARTMTEADKKHVDGCAIFYKQSKFRLVSKYLVEFNQLAIEAARGSHDMINRVMTKDNIGLAALLETQPAVWENGGTQQQQQLLLVATCHIHWDPDYSDVKLIQTMMLMNELKNIVEEVTSLGDGGTSSDSDDCHPCCSDVPLILCGDFNSLPNSGVVEFLNNAQLSVNHRDFKDISYDGSLLKLSVSADRDVYRHAFSLAQAYSTDVMPYTNYTSDFKGIIDYMFYSQDVMKPLGLLGLFDTKWFQENRIVGCPNPQIPSDHLPLFVEYEMYAAADSSDNDSVFAV